ncbi:MAG: hypothetical protein WA741_24205 [Candidatus Sulfotelmatobacter sp.]
MPYSLPEKQVQQLSAWIAAYIADQRTAFHRKAAPIGEEHKKQLAGFFPADVLNKVRIVRGRAPQPPFHPRLRELGIRNAPPFSEMAGITFQDVVVHVGPLTLPFIFHELVHAVQYTHLGLQGFADAYVRGFLTGGSYEEIPLEKQAYELEGKFSANSAATFSVEDDVQSKIRSKYF